MQIKETIKQLIANAVTTAHGQGQLPSKDIPEIELEEPKLNVHGDLSTNLAMISAKIQKMAPRKIAEIILGNLKDSDQLIDKTEIAGPGFINFFLKASAWHPVLKQIQTLGHRYGASDMGKGKRVQVEFVSANPTGPLHVGHGRGAAVGDSVAAILSFCGYDVQKEYYINDSGRQIQTLGRSVYLRYLELAGQAVDFPKECYQGDYIVDIARQIRSDHGDSLLAKPEQEAIDVCARFASDTILDGIRQDLKDFGVEFDQWYSEQKLYDTGQVDAAIADFRSQGIIYEKDGALWFRTSDFGDEKDRVVVKTNGDTTYFASDIAYHREKYQRGFEWVIDVWGADHHGYIPRMAAAIMASGMKREQFNVVLVHLVNLLRAGEPVAMSTRAGEFETLRAVVDEVGRDAARFIFLTRHYESPLDFDLELARQQTNDNPVYYVQYVHARISSIMEKARDQGFGAPDWSDSAISRLVEPEEITLLKTLARYPEVVASAASQLEPHRITYYLTSLASVFHNYYNKHRVLVAEDGELANARLCLIAGVQTVIRNGLTLLGVSAPDKM